MRWQQVQRLLREHLEPQLDGFRASRRELVTTPLGWLLRSISFGESRWETGGLYVEVLAQPLYVPKEYRVMTYGHRVGGSACYWEVEPDSEAESMARIGEAIRTEGLSFLRSLSTVAAFAKAARKQARGTKRDYYYPEEAGYSYLLLSQPDHAVRWLRDARDRAAASDSPKEPWAGEVRDRVDRVMGALDSGGVGAAREILLEWRAYTAEQLKIPADFLAEDPDVVDLR